VEVSFGQRCVWVILRRQ